VNITDPSSSEADYVSHCLLVTQVSLFLVLQFMVGIPAFPGLVFSWRGGGVGWGVHEQVATQMSFSEHSDWPFSVLLSQIFLFSIIFAIHLSNLLVTLKLKKWLGNVSIYQDVVMIGVSLIIPSLLSWCLPRVDLCSSCMFRNCLNTIHQITELQPTSSAAFPTPDQGNINT